MKKVWSLVHVIHQTDLIIDYTCVYFQCVAPETFQEKIHLVNSSFIQRKQMVILPRLLYLCHVTEVTLPRELNYCHLLRPCYKGHF